MKATWFARFLVLGCATFLHAAPWQPAQGLVQRQLWPGTAPNAVPSAIPEDSRLVARHPVAGRPWLAVDAVSRPTFTVYPAKGLNTGVAVLVFPGGGYEDLAIDLEGTEVCEWLSARGITGILLKYRVPGNGRRPKSGAYPDSPTALEDAQRALGLVRYHAAEWHIDPHKIGVLGFSAGGHLVAAISTHFDRRLYPAVDEADKVSCRPDFAVALYPGHLLEHTKHPGELNPYVPVTGRTPPTFLLQAENDPVDDIANSLVYFAALKKAGVPAELHVYPEGGHAFGLRRTKFQITAWPSLVESWLRSIGMTPR